MSHPEPRKWFPKNPEKYIGDVHNIIARSSWEIAVLNFLDLNPSIISYCSEEVIIPYLCGTDNRIHRYYPDFVVKYKTRNGRIKTAVVEVKPAKQTVPPVRPKRQTKYYINECMTYIKNQSKWKAAKEYADANGMEFLILTEHEIYGKNKK